MSSLEKEVDYLPSEESIVFHDSLSGQKRELCLGRGRTTTLYLCGPTVYSSIHIGNLRPVLFFDLIVRVLSEKNIDYKYVQNITDVDDKIIKQSVLEKKKESLLAGHYIKEYRQILKQLNIITPEFHLVTENIGAVVSLIKRLVTNGSAYIREDSILFGTDGNFRNEYGKLSKQLISKLSRERGRRINEQQKRSEKDFILWKKTGTGISWQTEWSTGRPGWHSECTAIIDRVFRGETIDIHGGGKDLLFPHHENERIQYIAVNKRELSRIWLHFGLVLIQNTKMSKSEGDYPTAKNFIREYGGNTLRMLLLKTRYSEDIEVSKEVVTQAVNRVRRIENIMKRISLFFYFNKIQGKEPHYSKKEEVLRILSNNLETNRIIKVLEENINFINKEIDNTGKRAELEIAVNDLLFSLKIMGFDFQVRKYDAKTRKILQDWRRLSVQGEYREADHLRQILQKKMVV